MDEVCVLAVKHIEVEDAATSGATDIRGSRQVGGKCRSDHLAARTDNMVRDEQMRPHYQQRRDAGGRIARNPQSHYFTPLNARRSQIMKEVSHTKLIVPLTPSTSLMGLDWDKWCEFHRAQRHDIEECRTLMSWIEKLIREGYLGKYVKRNPRKDGYGRTRSRSPPRPQKQEESGKRNEGANPPERSNKGTMYSIACGFAGGGTTNSASMRYARSVMAIHSK